MALVLLLIPAQNLFASPPIFQGRDEHGPPDEVQEFRKVVRSRSHNGIGRQISRAGVMEKRSCEQVMEILNRG